MKNEYRFYYHLPIVLSKSVQTYVDTSYLLSSV